MYGSCDILIKNYIFKVVIIGAVEMTQFATTPEDLSSILGPTKVCGRRAPTPQVV